MTVLYNIMNIITFAGVVQGLFFGLVLFNLKTRYRKATRFLALFLFTFSLTMAGGIAYNTGWILHVPHLSMLHVPFGAVIGVPLLLYIKTITNPAYKPVITDRLLFLPFGIILIWLLPYYFLPAAGKKALLLDSYQGQPVAWKAIFAISALANVAVLVMSYLVILRHERIIQEVYSDTKNKTLLWTRQFFYSAAVILGLCVLMSLVNITLADATSNMLFTLVIYVFGYRALRQPEIFSGINPEAIPQTAELAIVPQKDGYEKSGLSESKAAELRLQIEHLMNGEQLYLNPELNIQQLADKLRLPPYQVSQLLNRVIGVSFADFVNKYRTEHFKQLATNPANDHLSILALAYDSGFNSKAAFNAIFKKLNRQTPSEFRQNALQNTSAQ
ncbi:AraC family transcriptional regulator [Sphingobacteriales bacterium UPWRP_1]|nr:hypothetical protein BVG80_11550 [Sphingobacteriales bacterium TSM_CSM]PSJ76479.1 AraC family transcriptional regulator [Sphingobacteriales bacterium UPWRP_1]